MTLHSNGFLAGKPDSDIQSGGVYMESALKSSEIQKSQGIGISGLYEFSAWMKMLALQRDVTDCYLPPTA
jgi:hypothetical protein